MIDPEPMRSPQDAVPGSAPGGDRATTIPDPESPIVRILVTDDHPEMLAAVEQALGDHYEIECASSFEQAMERLAGGDFQLAICNINDASGAGLQLAMEIVRAHPDTATLVLATGEDDREAAREAFDSGVYSYLVEPFWPGQMLITVMNALRRRELEIAARKHQRNLEEQRQAIINMAPISIYVKDASGRYIVANEKADELAGLSPGELMGVTDESFLGPGDVEVGPDSDRRVFAERAEHEREDTVEIGGVDKTFKTVRFPLFDEEGEVTAAGGISVDITSELAAKKEALRLRDELTASQQKAIDDLELSRQETIEGLAKAINLHDPSTGRHVNRMAAVAAFLATELGLDPRRVELLRAAAPMHDVGKIGTRAELLCKPGPLTQAERSEMQRHTVIGHQIFAHFESELSRMAAVIALTHHERFDGSGYPDGLSGEEIPLEGRVTAVADVFDALLSDRSYREAMSVGEAVEVIRAGRGGQFDPEIVDLLLDHLDEAMEIRAG